VSTECRHGSGQLIDAIEAMETISDYYSDQLTGCAEIELMQPSSRADES